jgi:hypothetical protein
MSVKITLTVDYADVPKEADAIVGRALSRVNKVLDSLVMARSTEGINQKLKILEEARQDLILIDANIEDGYNILLGFAKHELELKTPPEDIDDKQE